MDTRRLCLKASIVWLLLMLLGLTNLAVAESRVALVIGNAAYQDQSPLSNALHDAQDVAGVLERAGFEVMRLENGSRRAINGKIGVFLRRLRGKGGVGLVYYSGHGLQVDGKNYLIPVDAEIRTEWDVTTEGVSVDRLLAGMDRRGEGSTNLVILDACRNNPYQSDKGIGDKGLARVIAPSSTLILYATRPGKTAYDNPSERNGLFTKHLLAAMTREGAEVEDAFRDVVLNVYRESGQQQHPWKEGALLKEFLFFPTATAEPEAPPPPPKTDDRTGDGDTLAVELMFWESVKDSKDPAEHQAYLDRYPDGRFAVLARLKLAAVKETPEPEPVQREEPKEDSMVALLTICNTHLKADRLTTGAGGNAFDCFQDILKKEPRNMEALDGLDRIVKRYLSLVESNLKRGRRSRAEKYLARAKQVNPEHSELEVLEDQPAEAKPAERSAPSQTPTTAPVRRSVREPEMVRVRGGCFQMGSVPYEPGRDNDERRHRVCVDDFFIGKHEVTRSEFGRFVTATGYRTEAEKGDGCFHWDKEWKKDASKTWQQPGFSQTDRHPVVCVSWNDAVAYTEWLAKQTGEKYRLPTEAQWEYAARAGTVTARYWGARQESACKNGNLTDLTAARAFNFRGDSDDIFMCEDGYMHTAPVGSFRPNPYGLYDVLGNVWEWTCSEYGENYGGAENKCVSKNRASGAWRVLRGGSWYNFPRYVRAASRSWDAPAYRGVSVGFRLARPL